MKLTIVALGSRGDVQPCVALGRGLASAGHAVRLVTSANFEALVRGQGLDFFPVDFDAQALTTEMIGVQMRGKGLNLLRMYRGMMRTFGAITDVYHRSFSSQALRDADALLSQLPGGFYVYDLAEALGVPYIALSVIPQETTNAWPFSMFPSRRSYGPRYNRLTYLLARQLAWQQFRRPINRFRRELGLPPADFMMGNIRRMARERVPVVQGFSEHIIPTPPDWGDHIFTTGYWTLDEREWQPPAALTDFLSAGEPSVFVGFGSMPVQNPEDTTRLILDALRQSGRRGILHAGWAELGGDNLPHTVYSLDYAPYEWLFPHMAAVVHHGGSGTTGLALRSGVPSLVVPFTADQPFWGERTHALGVGPAAIPFSKLAAASLAQAIDVMHTDASMKRQAMRLREAMAGEDGVARATQIIQTLLENS